MPLGPGHALWRQLHEALTRLALDCGGLFAFVVDEGNGLWCLARSDSARALSAAGLEQAEEHAADRFYKAEVAPRAQSMRKSHRIRVAVNEGPDLYAATSFASLYMVAVWFDAPFAATVVLPKIAAALPEIERLTLLLPPDGDPGANEGAAKRRA